LNDRNPSRFTTFALAGMFALGIAAAGGRDVSAQAPPPPPVPSGMPTQMPTVAPAPTVSVTPLSVPTPLPSVTAAPPTAPPTPSPRGRRGSTPRPSGSGSPAPTATPTSPAFASLDGTWEVQVQYPDHTLYSFFVLRQKDNALSGAWRVDGKEYPLEGTYDGRLIRITVKQPAGEVSMAGYVENASDMVGLVDYGKGGTSPPFTAEHRGPAPHGLLQKY
jgi:hypothetical protein